MGERDIYYLYYTITVFKRTLIKNQLERENISG